jgi:hypothetical protein
MPVQISNGTTVPHATDYSDLLSKLKTFALANGWTSLEDSSDKLVLQGSGSGSDQIIVAFQKYANVGSDSYGWYINGYSAYVGSSTTFYNQPGAMSATYFGTYGHPVTPLWNSTTPYWFIVSARRIIVVAKVSTTYQMCYAGFILPYATPAQMPYPLAIGGSCYIGNVDTQPRYSGTNGRNSMLWKGVSDASYSKTNPPFYVRGLDGSWIEFSTANGSTTPQAKNSQVRGMHPYIQADVASRRNAVDGSAVLTPVELLSWVSTSNTNRLGEIDGVLHVPGFGQSPETIVTVSGTDHLVLPNVFRSGDSEFAAIKLA